MKKDLLAHHGKFFQRRSSDFIHSDAVVMHAAATAICMHVFFYFTDILLKQPYENAILRAVCILITLPALKIDRLRGQLGTATGIYLGVITFIQLGLFMGFMYSQNLTTLWLSYLLVCVAVSFFLLPLRFAVVNVVLGNAVGYFIASALAEFDLQIPKDHFIGFLFALFCSVWASLNVIASVEQKIKTSQMSLGILAHELRTPLASVGLIADLIASFDDPRAKEASFLAKKALRKANLLIDQQIIDAMNETSDLSRKPFKVSASIAKAIQDFKVSVDSLPDDFCELVVDRDFELAGSEPQFRRVIINLLKNSVRAVSLANRSFSNCIHIRLSSRSSSRKGVVTFSDIGIGIPSTEIPLVWAAFHSTNKEKSHGLGLYYVKKTIEEMFHGKIHLQSVLGERTTFTIELKTYKQDS